MINGNLEADPFRLSLPAKKRSLAVLVTLTLLSAQHLRARAKESSCAAQHYEVITLPLRPVHINNSNQVAGTTSGRRAALWSKGKGLRELPLPPGFYNSEAIGMNNSGHVTGVAYDRGFRRHQAFMFAEGRLTLLPGEQSRSHWINDLNEIVGEAVMTGKTTTDPVFWRKEGITSLGGCCGGSATGINNHGQVIGDIYNKVGSYQAFLWDATRGLQLIGPPNRFSSAVAANDSGHVVIQAFSEAYLYEKGKLKQLDLAPRFPSQPRAINNCDVVAGSFGPFADAERAFVWERSNGFRDLNTLIPPDSGWKLEAATSVNDHGEIVGWGDRKGEDDSGFLLIPLR
jgi:probable HAF family extracellular repeat protein